MSKPKTQTETVSLDSNNFCENNSFYIYGYFDSSIATKILPNLIKEVEEQARLKQGKIKFYIDSNGGYANYLYNLLALIESAKKQGIIIETHVYAGAYSCASMLACSGTKGYRYISENAEHLCHLGAGGFSAANDVELERDSSALKAHFNRVRKLYKKYANIKKLEEAIMHDSLYFRGKEIISNGLADKIID